MGCFLSKGNIPRSQEKDDISSDDSSDCPAKPPPDARIGIVPISSSISISSDEDVDVDDGHKPNTTHKLTNSYQLVSKLAVGIQEISEDESSQEVSMSSVVVGRPSATVASSSCWLSRGNESMDDMGDESVVDWLAESSTTLFTSTTLGGGTSDEVNRRQTNWFESDPTAKSDSIHPENNLAITRQQTELNTIPNYPKKDTIEGDDEHVVIDTTRIERRHVPLPTSNVPSATKGDWLTNRYMVNDYIVLTEIGRGAHAEVRLCKHKAKNELFAVKIMNRQLLQSKIDIEKEVDIMKRLRHANILRLYEVLDDPKGK